MIDSLGPHCSAELGARPNGDDSVKQVVAPTLLGLKIFERQLPTLIQIKDILSKTLLTRIGTTCWLNIFVALLLVCRVSEGEEPLELPLWPGAVPGDYGTIGPERVRGPSEAPTENAKWITNVTKPTLTIFRPAKDKNTGTAILICPGGGYWNLAWDLEGEEVAAWLNTIGVTGIVLKYRVPRRPDQPERLPAPGPLLDAQRAISLTRSHAAEWGIDPGRVGIIGFSAGGHLAIATATQFDPRGYELIDATEKLVVAWTVMLRGT